jgi:molybdopterin/thiamine biosynthesis adenylyltransferase
MSDAARPFSYDQAFSRNIGWVTPDEQIRLRGSRVAIAGAGGVGFIHTVTLARLGIGAFHVADFDTFDQPNFNRQAGAFMSTVGQPKTAVAERTVLDINPEADVRVFPNGISTDNIAAFLDGVDLYVDALDFFAFDIRQRVFAYCAEHGIPAITAAPLGMGVAMLNFMPGQMTFEQYFQWGDQPELEKAVRFLVGLAPAGLHRPYLVVPEAVNLKERKGPSTVIACQLCAGVIGANAVKILLRRGKVLAAPHAMQYDAFRDKMVRTWRPGGNSHPVQRLAMVIARRVFARALLQ